MSVTSEKLVTAVSDTHIVPKSPKATKPAATLPEPNPETVQPKPEPEAGVEDSEGNIIGTVAHAVSVPFVAAYHGLSSLGGSLVGRVHRTNDIRRGRKAMNAAQRKMLMDYGRAIHNDKDA